MYTRIALFLLCKFLWAYPIFLPPPINPVLWKISSPTLKKALSAYINFRYQDCLIILEDKIATEKPSNENEWGKIELRTMSWLQLGILEKIDTQVLALRKIISTPYDLHRLDLLEAITELWVGQEDSRLAAKKLRNLRSEWKSTNNFYNLQIMAQFSHLAYLWHEERLDDMPDTLRNLNKTLSKFYTLDHPAWNNYHVYKILVHSMKYAAQNRYILPIFNQIKRSTPDLLIHKAIYFQSVKGFCYVKNGEISRGLRHLEHALISFEENIGNSSPLTLKFGIELSNLLWKHNQFSEAYYLASRLHKICNTTLGPKSQITIRFRIIIAKSMSRMRRSSEALTLLRTTLNALQTKKQIRLAAEINLELCRLFLEQDKLIESENHLNIGRQIAIRHFQSNHSIISEYQRLAITLRNRKNTSRIENLKPTKTIYLE